MSVKTERGGFNMKKRRITALFLAGVMAFSMTACGGASKGENGGMGQGGGLTVAI